MIIGCSSKTDHLSNVLSGTWSGQIINYQELSYDFDSRGYLPVKVVELPGSNSVKLSFKNNLVSLSIDGITQEFNFTLENQARSSRLIISKDSKILELEIMSLSQDQLELRLPNEAGSKHLYSTYLLERI